MNPQIIGQSTPEPEADEAQAPSAEGASAPDPAAEIGGRGGLEPTRYGDWEKNGRCIDF